MIFFGYCGEGLVRSFVSCAAAKMLGMDVALGMGVLALVLQLWGYVLQCSVLWSPCGNERLYRVVRYVYVQLMGKGGRLLEGPCRLS